MRFLKTLFWLVVAVIVTLFAAQNWRDVTIDLWGNLQADVKLPVLLTAMVLIGFLPTWLTFRAKLWKAHNRMIAPQREAPRAPEPAAGPAE
ncbi:MAG TPA: hypothetical protein VFU80_00450 [Sphingomicrobium sp.]|nr:hypothetical protein [Sphingomicrobium sp.]